MVLQKAGLALRKAIKYDSMVYDILSPHINGGSLLSVGCGNGSVESRLGREKKVNVRGVEVTKYKNSLIPIDMYNGKKLPFKDKTFDTVIFVYMLHHTNNIKGMLAEAKRVARKSVLILDHTYDNPFAKGLLMFYDYASNFMFDMPIPLNFLKVKQWFGVFSELGLKIDCAYIPTTMNVFFKLVIR